AIIADNGPEWIAAALAVIRAGGVVVPLDVQLGDKALRHVFGDSTPRFVFTTRNRAERIVACAENARIVLLDATDQDERSWRRLLLENAGALPKLGPEDHATLFYTSGTTGPPKGVPLTHSNLSVQINAALATGLTSENDHLLLPLPLHHVYQFVVGLLRPLASGGAALDPELAMKLEGLGWQVAIGYGLTETSPLLTFNLPGQAPLDSVGKPIRGVELRIRTPEKEERVDGLERQGEVLARGPSVFTACRTLEEKTREAFTEGRWFH